MRFVHHQRLHTSASRLPFTSPLRSRLRRAPQPFQRTAWHRRAESFPRRSRRMEIVAPLFCSHARPAGRPSCRRAARRVLSGVAAGAASAGPGSASHPPRHPGRQGSCPSYSAAQESPLCPVALGAAHRRLNESTVNSRLTKRWSGPATAAGAWPLSFTLGSTKAPRSTAVRRWRIVA
jgi:hypothetical protein